MAAKPVSMQRGPRRKLLNQIGDITGTRDTEIKKKRMSAEQIWTVYEEITGESRDMPKGRGWALKKILEELDNLEYKSYTNDARASVESLKLIRDELKNQ